MSARIAFPFVTAVLTAIALPAIAGAQTETPARTPPGPPVQKIATASAVSTEQLGSIMGVRELPDGRVLVNDGIRRRLLLMDTMLTTVHVVLDSLSDIANTYGTRPGALIPYRADSTLFVDAASLAVVMLDPAGKMGRVRSVWRVQDIQFFANPFGSFGWPGADAKGRIVYRIPARAMSFPVMTPSGIPYVPPEPDSAFIIAMNLETRRPDTLGTIHIPKSETRIRRTGEGSFTFEQVMNPLPATDDWALLPDGAVAFVRWRDYRVEFLNPDGTRTSSQKLPFEWLRITDEDKARLVDSTRTAQQRNVQNAYLTSIIRWVNMYNKPYPDSLKIPQGFVLPPGLPKDWILPKGVTFPATYIYACAAGVEPSPPTGGMPSCFPAPISFGTGQTPPFPTMRPVYVIDPSELPDYKPPIPSGATRADMEGNLWIRTSPAKPIPGGPVYDIVNRQGELVNRIQLPPAYSIAGFGRGKVVYLTMRDPKGIHLARVRLR